MPKTLADFIVKLSKEYATSTAIVDHGDFRTRTYTYSELYSYVLKIAGWLKSKGLKKGDVLLLYAPNSADASALLLACALSGIIIVPADIQASNSFIEKVIKETNPKLIISSRWNLLGKENEEKIEAVEYLSRKCVFSPSKLLESDIFEIIFTSGTTADPKGVVLTHKNIVSNISALRQMNSYPPKKRFLSILPLSHVFEQTLGLFSPLRFECEIHYVATRRASALLSAIKKFQIEAMVTVPYFLESIYANYQKKPIKSWIGRRFKLRPGKLTYLIVGGAPLDLQAEKFWSDLGVHVLKGYGLTETSPLVSGATLKENKLGSVGKVLPNVSVKLKDGEILVRGPNVMREYFKNPKATRAAFDLGWYKTGDRGELDSEGFLYIKGRNKNMILTSSGMNVYPEDLEQVLNSLGAEESCVLPIQSGKYQSIAALVVSKMDGELLRKKANEKLGMHQQIQQLKVQLAPLPRTRTKKIDRKKISAEFGVQTKKSDDLFLAHFEEILGKTPKETQTMKEIGIDSLGRLLLLAKIEETFDVNILEDEVTPETTILELREKLKNKSKKDVFGLLQKNRVISWIRVGIQIPFLLISRLLWRVEVQGELAPGSILIANHSSHADLVGIISSFSLKERSKLTIVAAKDYFFRFAIVSVLSKFLIGAIPMDRSGSKTSIQLIGNALDVGNTVLLFPEGSRSASGKPLPFKLGSGMIAAVMHTPIQPVKIMGANKALPKGAIIPRRATIKVIFGNAFEVDTSKSFKEIVLQLEKEVLSL